MPRAHISGDANAIAAMALLVADRARGAAEAAAGSTGAVAPALCALHEFASGRPIEVLAGALGVSHSRAVRVIDGLAERGLARRRAAPDDARVVHVELTARRGARGPAGARGPGAGGGGDARRARPRCERARMARARRPVCSTGR